MNEGCIISGYPGIGKSTLANAENGYIDLESSMFYVNGIRYPDWYIPYCDLACDLANQGYRVFISSNIITRSYLSSLTQKPRLYTCFPDYSLKYEWINKLAARFDNTMLLKDIRAFTTANSRYDEHIKALYESEGFTPIIIRDMDYDLKTVLEAVIDG